jgi:hypothetical protein
LSENRDEVLDQKERDTPVLVSPMAGGLGGLAIAKKNAKTLESWHFSQKEINLRRVDRFAPL